MLCLLLCVEIKKCDGSKGNPIFILIRGDVFDVTKGANFYGPGAGYHGFAGRDATIMLATMKTDPNDPSLVGKTFDKLTAAELETLEHWYTNVFTKKYSMIGHLKDNRKEN